MQFGRYFAAIALGTPVFGLASPSPAAGLAGIQASPLPPSAEVPDPVIPLRLPGYELRVLDRRKPIRFNVAGVWAESTLPVFVYLPTGDPMRAAGLLRQAYDDLLKLGLKPEWTAAELKSVLTNLDAAIRALEPGNTEAAPKVPDKAAQAAPQPVPG